MNEKNQEKQDNLYYKILERLNSDPVISNDEIASFYDISNAVKNGIEIYNKELLDNEKKYLKLINKNSRKLSFPKAVKIISYVNKDNLNKIEILFDNDKKISILTKKSSDIKIEYSDFDYINTQEFILKNIDLFNIISTYLYAFKCSYPNVDYVFKNNESYALSDYSQVLNDGFISYIIDMNCSKGHYPHFSNPVDAELSKMHNPKYGVLEDYLSQAENCFLKRSYVERSELNPLIDTMLKNYLNEPKKGNPERLLII